MKIFILLASIGIIALLVYFLSKSSEENNKQSQEIKTLKQQNSAFETLIDHYSIEFAQAYESTTDAIAKLNMLELEGEYRVQLTAALIKLTEVKEILDKNKKYNVKNR